MLERRPSRPRRLVAMLSRRAFLRSSVALAALAEAPRALAEPPPPPPPRSLTVLDLAVEGPRAFGPRFTLFVPSHLARDERVPLLVLLHGLGETGDPRLGVYAWHERYGLGDAYDRLRRPPLIRGSKRIDIEDAQLAALNAQLAAQPFRGLAIACPFTPNLPRRPDAQAAFDAYAAWITEVVIPRARREAPVILPDPAHTALDGCSLGGAVGLEVFLRRPERFASFGGVQSAFSVPRAAGFAERIAAAAPRMARVPGAPPSPAIHLLTSSGDPFRDANLALARELGARGVAHAIEVLPGPHDQPWLREAGTPAMLLWHDRRPR